MRLWISIIAVFTLSFYCTPTQAAAKATSAPIYFTATISGSGEVVLTWGEPKYWESGIKGGYALYSKAPGAKSYVMFAATHFDILSYVATGLTPGVWGFKIEAFGGSSGRHGSSRQVTIDVP